MRYTYYHTHPNPKHGKDEPIAIIVAGVRCAECAAQQINLRVQKNAFEIEKKEQVKVYERSKSKLKPGSKGDILAFAFFKLAEANNGYVTYEQTAILCPAYPGDPALWAREAGGEVITERKNRRYKVVKYV